MEAEILLLVLITLVIPIAAIGWKWRWGGWVFLLLMPAYMYQKFIVPDGSFVPAPTSWPTMTKDLVGIVLIATGAVVLVISSDQHQRRVLRDFGLALGVFVAAAAVLSVAQGVGPTQLLTGMRPYLLFQVVGIVMGILMLREVSDWTKFARVLMVVGVVVATLALLHRYLLDDFLIHESMRQRWAGVSVKFFTYRNRLRSIFSSANTLGYFMGVGILATAWVSLRAGRSHWVISGVLLNLVFGWVMLLSQSRSALLATLLCLAYLALRLQAGIKHAGKLIGAFVLLGMVMGGVALGDRLTDLMSNPRLLIWGVLLGTTLASPITAITGHGFGSIGRFGLETVSATRDEGLIGLSAGNELFFVDNSFVRMFYETGVLGLLFALWIAFQLWFIATHKGSGKPASHRVFASALAFFIVIISFFSESLITYPWQLLLWMTMAGAALRTKNPEAEVDR